MMALCTSENVTLLENVIKDNALFKKTLKTEIFRVILEIVWNVKKKNGKCRQCFSKKVLKGFKKHKRILQKLLKNEMKIEKRKKGFLNSSNRFKKWMKNLCEEFVENCLEKAEDV